MLNSFCPQFIPARNANGYMMKWSASRFVNCDSSYDEMNQFCLFHKFGISSDADADSQPCLSLHS